MATPSPYFTEVRTPQADFSPLTQAGANIGRMYADMGVNIGRGLGQLIGGVGSKYFDDKKTEKAMTEYLRTDEGVSWAVEQGYNPFDIQEWQEDPKKISKEVSKMFKEIGVDNIRSEFRNRQANEMAQAKFKQTTDLYNLEKRKTQLTIDELENARAISENQNLYLAHLTKSTKDGRKNMDQLDPSRGFDMTGKDGKIDPLKVQAVMAMNKSMGLAEYSPQMKVQMMESFKRNDEGGSGKRLESINFKSKSDFNRRWSEFTMNNPNLPPEQVANLKEELRELIVPEGGVRTIINGAIEKNQFGAFAETMKTQFGTMARFRSQLDLAFGVIEDSKGQLKRSGRVANPVAASIALMQMARMAQGVGVLSDKDVDRIGGSKTISATIERLEQKLIGKEVKLTKKMIEDGGDAYLGINPETGEQYEVGDPVRLGGAELSTADLTFFEQIADALDARAKTLVDVVVPQIYEEVRATYGGLTTNEIHEFSDLDIFYPQGFRKEGEVASQVDQRDVEEYHNLLRQGFDPDFIDKNMISDPSFRPEEGDHDRLGETRRQALEMFNSDENATTTEVGDNTGKGDGDEEVTDPNLNDGGLPTAVSTGLPSAYAGGRAANAMQDKLNKNQAMKEFSKKYPNTKLKIVEAGKLAQDGSPEDVKKLAKQFKVNTNNLRGDDEAIRKAVKKKVDAEVKKQVGEFLGKQGLKYAIKKSIVNGIGAILSGGTGFAVGSVLYDILALDAEKTKISQKVTLQVIDKTLSQLPDGEAKDALLNDRENYFTDIWKHENQRYTFAPMTQFEYRQRNRDLSKFLKANAYKGK